MTKDKQFKQAVRERTARTGEDYTAARRALRDTGSPVERPEAHYLLTPPGAIEHVDARGRRYLPVPPEGGNGFMWGYDGTGPQTASYALLLDATGSADPALAMSFCGDMLAFEGAARRGRGHHRR